VISAKLSPDGKYVFSGCTDGMPILWKISIQTHPELSDGVQANRYPHPLSCEEELQYQVETLYDQESP